MGGNGEDSRPDQESDVESGAARSAPEDPLLAERLGAPAHPRDIYMEESSLYRPIATGDIFQGVDVPGASSDEAGHDLTMVIAHPSAMRKRAALEPRARAAPVTPINGLRLRHWSPGYFDVYPLPLLSTVAQENGFDIANRGWGALIEVAAPVETVQLQVTRRIVCLSPKGIHLLLQRIVHSDTRYPVKEDFLARVFEVKLDELEMLQTWNEELVAPLALEGEPLLVALREAAKEFDDWLTGTRGSDGQSLRDLLDGGQASGEVHRRVHGEIRTRRSLDERGQVAHSPSYEA